MQSGSRRLRITSTPTGRIFEEDRYKKEAAQSAKDAKKQPASKRESKRTVIPGMHLLVEALQLSLHESLPGIASDITTIAKAAKMHAHAVARGILAADAIPHTAKAVYDKWLAGPQDWGTNGGRLELTH